jgi:MFS family permease
MATYGIGMWIGTLLSGYVKEYYTVNDVVDWKSIWLVPAGIAFVVFLIFTLFFKDNRTAASKPAIAESVAVSPLT